MVPKNKFMCDICKSIEDLNAFMMHMDELHAGCGKKCDVICYTSITGERIPNRYATCGEFLECNKIEQAGIT